MLEMFDEKPIEQNSNETYRFNWIREKEKPIVIRIDLHGPKEGSIIVKQTDGVGGFGLKNFGKLFIQEERKLSLEEVSSFRKALKKFEYWETKFEYIPPPPGGEYWEIEAFKNGTKHLLHDIEPDEGNVYDLGVQFLLLSTLPVREEFLLALQEKESQRKMILVGVYLGLLFIVAIFTFKAKSRSREKTK